MFRSEFWLCLVVCFFCASLTKATEADSAKQITDSLRTYQGQQVVVTGTRNEVRLKDSPVRVEVIGQERIKTTAMVSLGDLLKEQTGLLMVGNVRTGVQMNGLGPDYTMILIDGQPMVGRVAGVIDLSRISVGNVDRVEVVKGPMSSMYGSEALAGAINIITKQPEPGWAGTAQAQYLSRGPFDLRLEGGWGSDDVDVSTFINYKNAAAFTLPLDTLEIPYSGYQDGTAQAKVTWRIDKHWKLRGWMRAFGSETKGEFIESVFGQIASNEGSVQQWDFSSTIGTEWVHGRARLTLNAYGSSYHERYNFDVQQGTGGTVDDLTRRMARFYGQYDLVVGETNRMTVGGEFLYDDIQGTRYAVPGDTNARPFYRTGVAFAQWEGLPVDWISYVISARFDGNNVYGEALSPRFSLLWKPGDHLRLSGSVGTGFKAPDFRQLFVVFSNRLAGAGYDLIGAARLGNTLEPERSVSYDVGLRYEDGQRELSSTASLLYSADIRVFRNDLFNLIEYYLYGTVDGRNVYSYRNLARVYTQGFEVNLTTAIAVSEVGAFTISGGYQFLDAKDVEVLEAIDAGLAGTIDEPLTRENYGGLWNRSRNSGTLRLQFDDHERLWSTNVRFQFIGRYGDESLDQNGIVISDPPRKVLDREDEYVDGYTVMNVALTRQFPFSDGTSFSIGAGMNNVFDTFNPTLIPSLVGRQFFIQFGSRF
jgi:outer membrane receptor for ferrienterochelin and colicins